MRTLALAVALLACAALAAGCGVENETSTTSATAKPTSDDDLNRSVVAVEGIYANKKTIVTGVVFSANRGLVLTANHAIEAAPAIEVTLPNGTLVQGRAIARLHCHDLALIELNPKPAGVTELAFADSRDVRIDQPVRTLSYELTSSSTKRAGLTSTRGTVSAVGVREAFPPLPVTEPYIAHQSSLAASSSGSPLLNSAGKVVGINTLVGHPRKPDKPGVEYALTSNYIKRRLGQLTSVGGRLSGWADEHNACHGALRELIGRGHVHE
jgi:S1-C subfamily serine protease